MAYELAKRASNVSTATQNEYRLKAWNKRNLDLHHG